VNNLPAGASGNLKIPTDLTVMGAGLGLVKDPAGKPCLQSRAIVHLDGDATHMDKRRNATLVDGSRF
jgi:hypothetical protein